MIAITIALSGCATMPPRMVATPPTLPSLTIGGLPYVPLGPILQLYAIDWEWNPFTRTAILRRGRTEVRFLLGTNAVLINGELHRIAGPIAFHESGVVIPREFGEHLVQFVFGAKPVYRAIPGPFQVRTIVIDPGHGGHDPGAIGRRGLREKDVVLDIARRIEKQLDRHGIQVIMTRDRDRFIPLRQRAQIANDRKANFFISIHANAARMRQAHGAEVYYLSEATDDAGRAWAATEDVELDFEPASFGEPTRELKATLWDLLYTEHRAESVELAQAILSALGRAGVASPRGIKGARFYVLKGTRMPAILIEVGFLTNLEEEERLRSQDHRERVAEAIAEGILTYKQQYERAQGFTN